MQGKQKKLIERYNDKACHGDTSLISENDRLLKQNNMLESTANEVANTPNEAKTPARK